MRLAGVAGLRASAALGEHQVAWRRAHWRAHFTATGSGRAAGHAVVEDRASRASDTDEQILADANTITLLGVGVNLAAAIGKGVAGMYVGSSGLIADAGHSVSDLFSDAVTLFVVNHARVPATHSTPWGLGKLEAVGAGVCALLITGTGVAVGAHSIVELSAHVLPAAAALPAAGAALSESAVSGAAAVAEAAAAVPASEGALLGGAAAAIGGIVSKEWLFRETRRIALRARSATMLANAWHHRSDALSSVIALGGLCGTAAGVPVLDSVAGIAVAVIIGRAGVEMGMSAVLELIDTQVEPDLLERLRELLLSDPDALCVSHLRGRKLGPAIAVECRLQVPFSLSVSAAQQVATKAKLRVLGAMPEVCDVLVSLDAEPPARTGFDNTIVVGSTVDPSEHELMRSPRAIEADVRAALASAELAHGERLWGLSHSIVHWETKRSGAIVEASLIVDPAMSVHDAHELAHTAHDATLRAVPDLLDVDLHLELYEKSAHYLKSADDVPRELRLPSRAEASERLRLLREELEQQAAARGGEPRRQHAAPDGAHSHYRQHLPGPPGGGKP